MFGLKRHECNDDRTYCGECIDRKQQEGILNIYGEPILKSYGVVLTVAGHTYSFHVNSREDVRDLFLGCTASVEDFRVTEQSHDHTTVTYREMTYREVRQIIEGSPVAA